MRRSSQNLIVRIGDGRYADSPALKELLDSVTPENIHPEVTWVHWPDSRPGEVNIRRRLVAS